MEDQAETLLSSEDTLARRDLSLMSGQDYDDAFVDGPPVRSRRVSFMKLLRNPAEIGMEGVPFDAPTEDLDLDIPSPDAERLSASARRKLAGGLAAAGLLVAAGASGLVDVKRRTRGASSVTSSAQAVEPASLGVELPCRLLSRVQHAATTEAAGKTKDGSSLLDWLAATIGFANASGEDTVDPCMVAAPQDLGCAAWGEDCGDVQCCKEEGHQCFSKNSTYATCLAECMPGVPSLFHKDNSGPWSCDKLGSRTPGKAQQVKLTSHDVPAWVKGDCADEGADCSDTRCCATPGQLCYSQGDGAGRCRWSCTEGVNLHEARWRNWTCNELGPRTPGKRQKDKESETLLDWVSEECAKEGEDCSKTWCCADAGTQCYRKDSSRAECLATCPVPVDFHQSSAEGMFDWSCEPLGPRTPGKAQVLPTSAAMLTYVDLPEWVNSECSALGESCAKTGCCKEPGTRCFEQHPGAAFCRAGCLEGMEEEGHRWSCKELGPATPKKCPACAPKKLAPPDVVIPFFERDLCKLKVTAKSISVNDPSHFLGNVFLMWVSDKSYYEFKEEIDHVLEMLRETREATLLDFTDQMHATNLAGWHAQQMVKLKAASVVSSEFYVVLDSKNTIVRPLTTDPFFTSCNQGIIQAEMTARMIGEPHIDWYRRSAQALGVRDPKDKSWPETLQWPASITPMVMHRQSVLSMLDQLGEAPSADNLCQGQLCTLIGAYSDSGHGATEFTLYTLYVYNLMASKEFECVHEVYPITAFKIERGNNWMQNLKSKIVESGLSVQPAQLMVSNKEGWPIEWSPSTHDVPQEDQWPLSFTDLTRKWSAALWRGEPQDAGRLVTENLHVLRNVLNGNMNPIMFGAQPASLNSMNQKQKDASVRDIIRLYNTTGLLDPSEQDFVGCVVGWKN